MGINGMLLADVFRALNFVYKNCANINNLVN